VKKKISKKVQRLIIVLSMVVVLFVGVFMEIYAVNATNHFFYQEHDKRLNDFAFSIDQNISFFYQQCMQSLEAIAHSDSVAKAEEEYLQTGDTELFHLFFDQSEIIRSSFVEDLVALKDDKTVASGSDQDHANHLRLSEGNEVFSIIYDLKKQETFLALRVEENENGFSYGLLIRLMDFYQKVVPETAFETYWILLYEKESGLFLQNDVNQPEHKFFIERELQDRQDGYGILFQHEKEQKSGLEEYVYEHESYGIQNVRIAVIPSSVGKNGGFCIGVAIFEDEILKQVRTLNFLGIFSAVLIAIGIAGLIFYMLHNGKRERELAQEIETLEEEKRLTEELVLEKESIAHHQQLETIGTLTAGVAHEFNNLLSPIMGNSLLILENTRPEDSEIYDNALDIYHATTRAKELVANISKISRKSSKTQMHPMNAKQLFDSVMMIGGPSIPKKIKVVREIHTNLPFLVDEISMENLFLNLVINATQAIGEEGTITMEAHDDGTDVYLSVSDTGPGISEEKMKLIFEPFFTTKAMGKGTGLGLAIARQTAENHGATLSVQNIKGCGACFTLRIAAYK